MYMACHKTARKALQYLKKVWFGLPGRAWLAISFVNITFHLLW